MKKLIIIALLLTACSKPTNIQTVAPAPTPTATFTPFKSLSEARAAIIEKARAELEKQGVKPSVEGKENTILILQSDKLSDFEILQNLRESLDAYSNLGFTEITIIDRDKKRRSVDLKVLK